MSGVQPFSLTTQRERIRSLALEGLPPREIAARLGATPKTVHVTMTRLRREGEPIPFHARSGHAPVPVWVETAGLRQDFLDVAESRGEEAAASHCRRLKRECA